MDSKRQFVLQPESLATLNLLPAGNAPSESMPARVLRNDGKALLMSTPDAVKAGTAVTVNVCGGMILAEVDGCTEQAGNQWILRLTIDQIIPSLADLTNLMDAIMNPGARGQVRRSAGSANAAAGSR